MQGDGATRGRTEYNNSGTGGQYNKLGTGDQNINSGSGTQFNANNITFWKARSNFLADLRVTDPRDDKARIERTKGGLWKDSYRWILGHDDFRRWRAQSRLLWIKGDPGKGKTMLLCGIIDELEKMSCNSIFFFFCQATDTRLNTAASVLRGLLYLVLCQNASLISLFSDKYDHAGKQLFEDSNNWEALCKMFTTVLCHESLKDVVLVIDALDECTTGLDQLLNFIIELPTHVQVIVSSRNWPSIDRRLAIITEDTKIYVSLELNEQAISAAVDSYISHKVNQLAKLKSYDDQLKKDVNNYLIANSNNTFLWVALVCQQLGDYKVLARHTRRKLQELPPGLDSLYGQILNHILSSLDSDLCREMLAVMSIASRPLLLTELASLLSTTDFMENIIEECGLLLTVRRDTIYFIHQSAKDFLLGQAVNEIMPSGISHRHTQVLSKLLEIMSNTLRHNIYDLGDTEYGISIDEIDIPDNDPLASVRYAYVHWADHVVEDHIGKQCDQIYAFLVKHYLHWLEAVGLLRSISEGTVCIAQFAQTIRFSAVPEDQKRLANDAVRFIRYFRTQIEIYPLQVYRSGLVFSPTRSVIRNLFRSSELKWRLKPVVDDDWNPCLQTLEKDADASPNNVVFSPDNSTLAVAYERGTIKLWNTETGQCVQTLDYGKAPSAMAFLSDGVTLASTSIHGTYIWNTETGFYRTAHPASLLHDTGSIHVFSGGAKLMDPPKESQPPASSIFSKEDKLMKLKDPPKESQPPTFVFSGDGATLATTLNDNTCVVLRDILTAKCVNTLEDNGINDMRDMALSEDGTSAAMLMSAVVKIWHKDTGQYFELRGPENSSSVSISRDATRVAVSEKEKVTIWCSRTGGLLENIYAAGISRCLFSPDGTQLALLDGHDIIIWDINEQQRNRILSGHRDTVWSWAFSDNGKLLASASQDGCAKLWDLVPDQQHQPLHLSTSSGDMSVVESRQTRTSDPRDPWTDPDPLNSLCASKLGPVSSLFFSKNGRRIISTASDWIRIWDSKTGQCLRTVKNDADKDFLSAAFCLDKVYLTSNDREQDWVNIHDVNNITARVGPKIIRVRGRNLRVLLCAFSRDGTKLATVCRERGTHVLRLWGPNADARDMHEDYCTMMLGLPKIPTWLRFSETGSQLHTSIGIVDLKTSDNPRVPVFTPSEPDISCRSSEGYYIGPGDAWVMKDGNRFLWLPIEYRPKVVDIHGSMLALGTGLGRVLIFDFA